MILALACILQNNGREILVPATWCRDESDYEADFRKVGSTCTFAHVLTCDLCSRVNPRSQIIIDRVGSQKWSDPTKFATSLTFSTCKSLDVITHLTVKCTHRKKIASAAVVTTSSSEHCKGGGMMSSRGSPNPRHTSIPLRSRIANTNFFATCR